MTPKPPDLQLTAIWQNATWAAGHIGDAIKDRRDNPNQDVTKDLGEALILLNKATAEIQQILATSHA
jgi:hypothetical protein